ncbi:unnamed protein product [Mytilus coruscus]|uniref:Uncharacterized protein n=1 Tax=Mytilus coruscus TaxID=42192 RepID=A0A6J8AEG6_MYTCO|nr:unnamed protein product [Mytilus coruscus]
MDPPDQGNCHLHCNLLNTLQRTVNNTSEEVLHLQNQVKALFPSAKPSAETIMSNPFGFDLKEPLQQKVAASLLKLGRNHHELCIPSLVTSLQNIGWKVRMQNWSVSTIHSQLTIATSLPHCISTSGSSSALPTNIPQSATTSSTTHMAGTYAASSTPVISTQSNCPNSSEVTTSCSCCQDCIDALTLTNMLINHKLSRLNEICTTILDMLNTSVLQKSKLIQLLGNQCNNQISIHRQVSQLMISGFDGIYACSSVHSTQQHTLMSPNNFNLPSYTSSISAEQGLVRTSDLNNKSPVQLMLTNIQQSTSTEKTTVKHSNKHTPDNPPILIPQLPVQITIDTPESISPSPPVLTPQLPVQFTIDTPASISLPPPVLTPQVCTKSSFDFRNAKPSSCNYSKSLQSTLEEHMERFQKSEISNAYSILQDLASSQISTASMSPVLCRKRLFIGDDSDYVEQIKVTKRAHSSTNEPIYSLTDYPSLLAGMIVGHSSFKVTDDWPSYKSRQNMVNLWNIKPFYLKRSLNLYILHMYALYCGTEKPAYDVTSNRVSEEVLSEVLENNSSPTCFARDLVWRVLTLREVYQLHHGKDSFSIVMSAVKRATIDNFNISDNFWDTSCIDFIRKSNNYFFKNKLRSKVFQMFLRGNLPNVELSHDNSC